MKERIEVNGVWYVKEKTLQEELFISEFDGICYENDLFSIEVTRLKDRDGTPTENILMEYASKEVPGYSVPTVIEYWDNTDWMLGVHQGSPTSLKQLYPIMDEGRVKQIQSIIGTLIEKGWLKFNPSSNPYM